MATSKTEIKSETVKKPRKPRTKTTVIKQAPQVEVIAPILAAMPSATLKEKISQIWSKYKLFIVIGGVIILFIVGLRLYRNLQVNKETKVVVENKAEVELLKEEIKRKDLIDDTLIMQRDQAVQIATMATQKLKEFSAAMNGKQNEYKKENQIQHEKIYDLHTTDSMLVELGKAYRSAIQQTVKR